MANSDSDCEDLLEGSWSLSKRMKIKLNCDNKKQKPNCSAVEINTFTEQSKKFEELKAKASEIKLKSSLRRQKTEVRRSRKLLKKALKDPYIRAAVEDKNNDCDESKKARTIEWEDVKPYLSINDHLQGPVSHGDCGPKTELEYIIEDSIKEGDFEKAELLSDTLSNREFAVKIAHAFEAKRCQEKQEKEKLAEKEKQMKKIRWMFDAKEKWQMKGNM